MSHFDCINEIQEGEVFFTMYSPSVPDCKWYSISVVEKYSKQNILVFFSLVVIKSPRGPLFVI